MLIFRRASRAKCSMVIFRAERAEFCNFLTFAPPIRNMDRRPWLSAKREQLNFSNSLDICK